MLGWLLRLGLMLGWIGGSVLWAQIDVERFRGKSSLQASISYALSDTRTNEVERLGITALFNRSIKAHEFLTVGNAFRGDRNDEDFQDKSFLHLRYFYKFKKVKDFGPEFFYQNTSDEFSNQLRRRLFGAGLRKLHQTERFGFRGGVSVMRERLVLDRLPENETLWHTRMNTYLNLSHKIFSMTLYYQPNLSRFSDRNIAMDAQANFNLYKERLFLDIRLGYNENSTFDVRDRNLRQALRYKF